MYLPYSSCNKCSIGKDYISWHMLIFLHVVMSFDQYLFLWYFSDELKTQEEESRDIIGFGDWCNVSLWVIYTINPGKNERENYRLDMKWFQGDFSSFDKLNSLNFIELIHWNIAWWKIILSIWILSDLINGWHLIFVKKQLKFHRWMISSIFFF